VNAIGHGILIRARHLVEAFGLLADPLEDQVQLGLRADDGADEVEDRVNQDMVFRKAM